MIKKVINSNVNTSQLDYPLFLIRFISLFLVFNYGVGMFVYLSILVSIVGSVFIYFTDIKTRNIINQNKNIFSIRVFYSIFPRIILACFIGAITSYGAKAYMFNKEIMDIVSSQNVSRFSANITFFNKHTAQPLVFFLMTIVIIFSDTLGTIGSIYFIQKVKISEQEKELKNALLQQKNIIDAIQHELGNKLPLISNNFNDLKSFLIDFPETNPFRTNLKIREPFLNETIDEIDSLDDIIKKIDLGVTYSISAVENMASIIAADNLTFVPEENYFGSYLKDEISLLSTNCSNIEIISLGADPLCFFDKKQFKIVLNNLVENAIRHSFIDSKRKYKLVFELKETIDNGEEVVSLLISNSGEPFPRNFNEQDYLKQHSFAGKTGNTGIGGYLIGLVVQNHKGRLTIIEQQKDSEFKTNILIIFPKTI